MEEAMYQPPRGCQEVGENDPFVAKDGNRWFVMLNHDYEDTQGNMGMSTEYLADKLGYDTEDAAEQALLGLAN